MTQACPTDGATRRFRFAPTPSRPLHLGSAWAALVGWAAARAAGGVFLVRIEDIDRTRCQPEHEATALADLTWLGLDWDEGPDVGGPCGPYRQSERLASYDDTLRRLLIARRAYLCTCSRADVRRAQSAPHLGAGLGGTEQPYPGTCRPLDRSARATAVTVSELSTQTRGGVRLDVDGLGSRARVPWVDGWSGPRFEDVRRTCGDPLLGRLGTPTYQLAAVVDDQAMGITDVVRGRDLEGSTARQILLARALGHQAPRHWHHGVVLGSDGRKLSKREEATPLMMLRQAGATPARLIAELGRACGVFGDRVRCATPSDVAAALRDGRRPVDGTLRALEAGE